MNPDQLLRHFDHIAEAPDAVPRLRRFILDLAVRGKLVEQDPSEQPAGGTTSVYSDREGATVERRRDQEEQGERATNGHGALRFAA